MTIAIELVTDTAEFDETVETAFADLTWTAVGQKRYRGVGATGVAIGIVDPHEIMVGLQEQFGDIVDRRGLHAGSRAMVSDYIVERVLFHAGDGAPGTAFTISTATRAGFSGVAAGQLVRLVPAVFPTEVVDAFQAGGTGTVSITNLADGQAGVLTLPTGMRIALEGGDADTDNIAVLWLTPFADPRTLAKLAQGAQPPGQYA